MPYYRYWIRTKEGKTSDGHREAADPDQVRAWLQARGLLVLSIAESRRPAADPAARLSASESQSMLTEFAELQAAQLPLAPGLRAAAQVSPRSRLARAMRAIAAALDDGASFDEALALVTIPEHHRGLLLAANRSQRPAEVLLEMFEQQRQEQDVRSSIWLAISYPLLVLALTLLIFLATMVFVVRPFRQIFEEFQLKLPAATQLVMWWSDVGIWLLIAMCLLAAAGIVAVCATLGPARWQRLLITVPVLGPLWQWSGAAQFTRLLSIMLSHNVPLPDAVRYAGLAARNADIRGESLRVAELIERGEPLSTALDSWLLLPEVVPVYARWGEQHRSLPDSLFAVSEMLLGRVTIHAATLRIALPPFVLALVLLFALSVILSIYLPLRALMTGFM